MIDNLQTIYVIVGALMIACVAVFAYLTIIACVHRRLLLMREFHQAVTRKIEIESGYEKDQIDKAYLDKYIELKEAIETWLDREGMIRKSNRQKTAKKS